MKVYESFRDKVEDLDYLISHDSVVLCSLLHDLCKVSYYTENKELASPAQLKYLSSLIVQAGDDPDDYTEMISKKYAANLIQYYRHEIPFKPVSRKEWKVDDKLPLGHGEKSVYLAQRYVQLTEEEACIIRWHLAGFDPGIHFGFPNGYIYKEAVRRYPIIVAFFTADYEVSYLKKKSSNLY